LVLGELFKNYINREAKKKDLEDWEEAMQRRLLLE
jgi:hypothetical protein